MFQQQEFEEDGSTESEDDCNYKNMVIQAIENNETVAATDTSINNITIAGYWRLTNKYNDKLID